MASASVLKKEIEGEHVPECLEEPVAPAKTEEKIPDDDKAWVKLVQEEQNLNCGTLGDCEWNRYRTHLPSICFLLLDGHCECFKGEGFCENPYEMTLLKMKIGYARFQSPDCEPDKANEFTGYSVKKLEYIKDVCEKIKHNRNCEPNNKSNSGKAVSEKAKQNSKKPMSYEVLMSPVFVFFKDDDGNMCQFPVFRIPSPTKENDAWFIDHTGRVYKNWKDYVKNNDLPKGLWCYPKDGVYTFDSLNNAKLCIERTPACRIIKTVGRVCDMGFAGVGMGSAAVVVGALIFPPVAPLVAGSMIAGTVSGVYSAVRSSVNLADRGNHQQSISLKDREARGNWIGIVSAVLGIAGGAGSTMVKTFATRGKAIPEIGLKVATGVSKASVFVSGVGVANEVYELNKSRKDRTLSTLQICQFGVQVFFFFHAVYTMKSASAMYDEAQNHAIETHEGGLKGKVKQTQFKRMKTATLSAHEDPVSGKAAVIKGINYITSTDESYNRLFRLSMKARKGGNRIMLFGEKGVPVVEGQGSVPQKLHHCLGSVPQKLHQQASLPVPVTQFTTESPPTTETPHNPSKLPEGFSGVCRFISDLAESAGIDAILRRLRELCQSFPGGRYLEEVITILIKFRACKEFSDYMKLFKYVVEFAETLYRDKFTSRFSTNTTQAETDDTDGSNGQPMMASEEDVMEMVLKELPDSVGSILLNMYGVDNNDIASISRVVNTYHFPDHLSWGENGELTTEQYKQIGESAVGLTNMATTRIFHRNATAYVSPIKTKLVEINSEVSRRAIIVVTFDFSF